jgi:hypothetical protein
MPVQDAPERGTTGYHPGGTVCLPAFTFFNLPSTSVWSANDARGVRFIAHKTGKIQNIGFYVGVSSGNCDMAVYDVTLTTRTRLSAAIGSTAVGTVNTWQVFQPLATAGGLISVTEGDHFDVALAVDNGTVSVGRLSAPTAAGVQQLAAGMMPAPNGTGGGAGKLAWSIATSFPLPATLTDASLITTSVVIPHLFCSII